MNSTPSDFSSLCNINCSLDEKLNDMSPVTDLALNLKSLKTATGTPTRRISWTDPFANGNSVNYLSDLSPSADSPMLQEIFMKNSKKVKKSAPRKMLPLYIDEDKENFCPDAKSSNVISRNNSMMEIEKCSQDSGYSSTSSKRISSMRSTPFRVKSSIFPNTNFEEMDGLFPIEDDVEMESTTEFSMKSLLTKPLCNISNSSRTIKRGKLPIRRCLTMEMEGSSDSSSVKLSLCTESNITFSSMSDNADYTDVDIEPLKRLPFKRPDQSDILSWQSKRRKSSPSISISDDKSSLIALMKKRSFSETAATIMQAVQKADLQPELIGDCSRNYALPLVKGRHQDLKSISAETLVKLIKGEYSDKVDTYTLIDCRYPYEYDGGHIQGAENIYTKEDIMQKFLENIPNKSARNVIIFHCEFSSERAPNLCRFLRNKDREINECNYPKLHHPEIYVLEGGYKAFYADFRKYCVPQDYKPMNHKDHSSDLRFFRSKSKSWGSDSKSLCKMKSSSENSNV